MKTRCMRSFAFLAILMLAFSSFCTAFADTQNGTGSLEYPFIISSVDDFLAFRDAVDGGNSYFGQYIELSCDIMLDYSSQWNPVGSASCRFSGYLNGRGHTISGVTISNESDYQGLFAYCNNAVISNLKLTAVNVRAGASAGALAGYAENSSFINISVSCNVEATLAAGAIAGESAYCSFFNCFSAGSVYAQSYSGGIVGYGIYGSASLCTVTCLVGGEQSVGGIYGVSGSVDISSCTANTHVTGVEDVGGICGNNIYFGTIKNCESIKSVYGTENVGGIIGTNYYGEISYCKNSSAVMGDEGVGGILGHNLKGYCLFSANMGTINGSWSVGGIVGENDNSHVNQCVNVGDISGFGCVGGIVGDNIIYGSLARCYNTAAISGVQTVGGIVGHCDLKSFVRQAYSIGTFDADYQRGGVFGASEGVVEFCYYLSDRFDVSGSGSVALTASLMSEKSNYYGFDFGEYWEMGVIEDYPYPTFKGLTPGEKSFALGDANKNGRVDTADAVIILRCLSISGLTLEHGDLTRDNKLNSADAVEVLKKVCGIS